MLLSGVAAKILGPESVGALGYIALADMATEHGGEILQWTRRRIASGHGICSLP
jgi:hypothetical protein